MASIEDVKKLFETGEVIVTKATTFEGKHEAALKKWPEFALLPLPKDDDPIVFIKDDKGPAHAAFELTQDMIMAMPSVIVGKLVDLDQDLVDMAFLVQVQDSPTRIVLAALLHGDHYHAYEIGRYD